MTITASLVLGGVIPLAASRICKSADDATNATLAAYLVGAFGIAGSKEADDFCIKQLLPNKLKDQYCFKTTAALDCLHFVESEKIWLKK